ASSPPTERPANWVTAPSIGSEKPENVREVGADVRIPPVESQEPVRRDEEHAQVGLRAHGCGACRPLEDRPLAEAMSRSDRAQGKGHTPDRAVDVRFSGEDPVETVGLVPLGDDD